MEALPQPGPASSGEANKDSRVWDGIMVGTWPTGLDKPDIRLKMGERSCAAASPTGARGGS